MRNFLLNILGILGALETLMKNEWVENLKQSNDGVWGECVCSMTGGRFLSRSRLLQISPMPL